MRNTLEFLDNYLECTIKDELNIVDVLDHIFAVEARSKRLRAYEKQIQMSAFPIKKTLEDFDFSFQPSIDKRQIDELTTMRFSHPRIFPASTRRHYPSFFNRSFLTKFNRR